MTHGREVLISRALFLRGKDQSFWKYFKTCISGLKGGGLPWAPRQLNSNNITNWRGVGEKDARSCGLSPLFYWRIVAKLRNIMFRFSVDAPFTHCESGKHSEIQKSLLICTHSYFPDTVSREKIQRRISAQCIPLFLLWSQWYNWFICFASVFVKRFICPNFFRGFTRDCSVSLPFFVNALLS